MIERKNSEREEEKQKRKKDKARPMIVSKAVREEISTLPELRGKTNGGKKSREK